MTNRVTEKAFIITESKKSTNCYILNSFVVTHADDQINKPFITRHVSYIPHISVSCNFNKSK